MSGTGCKFLDKNGVSETTLYARDVANLCLYECPYNDCVLDRNHPGLRKRMEEEAKNYKDVTIVCLKCGLMESTMLYKGQLKQSGQFKSVGDEIWHYHIKGYTQIPCGKCRVYGYIITG